MTPWGHITRKTILAAIFLAAINVSAETLSAAAPSPDLPNAGASVFRVCGAFILVVAIFLGGVWLVKNSQKLAVKKSGGAKLNLLEVKTLGQRQALYVVGYQQQRLLIAASPAGVTLLSHLPAAGEDETVAPAVTLNFSEALQHVLSRRQ